MRGKIAAVVLLTVALLSDEDLSSLRLSTSTIPEISSLIDLQHAQDSFRRSRGSFWLPVARASPLLLVEERPIVREEPKVEETSSEASNTAIADDTKWHSADARWRPLRNSTEAMESVLMDQLDFPGRTTVPMGWADPRLRGGRMLDFTLPRRGEPLNAIISGLSDPYILTPQGLLHYSQSLGFSSECLGIHIGQLHIANLGDSMAHGPDVSHSSSSTPGADDPFPEPYPLEGGNKTEQLLARQNYDWPLYGWPDYGTCWESLVGGNHFRAWKQDGAGARTGAWFLAVSKELWLAAHHDIAPDGYNGGRDALVARALRPTRWSPTQEGIWWETDVTYNTTLLPPGKDGINHGISQDGKVAILTVRRRQGPPSYQELHTAWNEIASITNFWDPDIRLESRRGQWELSIGGDEGDVRITTKQSSSRWRWLFSLLYRTWALPRLS